MKFNVSNAELERRWREVRAAMEVAGLDVLVAQANDPLLGGYVRYLTDVSAHTNFTTVVFPQSDAMTLITHGPRGTDVEMDAHPLYRGVKRHLADPSFTSAFFTGEFDARSAVKALEPYARGRIGLVGTARMAYTFGQFLKEQLPQARFSEESALLDSIKAIKSPEELELIRQTARLQDEVMDVLLQAIEPGVVERELTALAWEAAYVRGSEAGVIICSSAPAGEAPSGQPMALQNRPLAEGDSMWTLIEVNGPGGLYAELGRTIVVGDAPDAMLREVELASEARRRTLEVMKPGVDASEPARVYNEFVREHARPEEHRIGGHSQGTDFVERPLLRFDEPMQLAAGMNLAVHPEWRHEGMIAWVCDNFIVGPEGAGESIHSTPPTVLSASR